MDLLICCSKQPWKFLHHGFQPNKSWNYSGLVCQTSVEAFQLWPGSFPGIGNLQTPGKQGSGQALCHCGVSHWKNIWVCQQVTHTNIPRWVPSRSQTHMLLSLCYRRPALVIESASWHWSPQTSRPGVSTRGVGITVLRKGVCCRWSWKS